MQEQNKAASKSGRSTPYTIRLDCDQRAAFEAIANDMGFESVGAAIKAMALRGNAPGAIEELRLQVEAQSRRISDIAEASRRDRDDWGARLDEFQKSILGLSSVQAALMNELGELLKKL